MLKKIEHCNVENVLAVRDKIANLADNEMLDMTDWYREHECGTSACIAGWACLLFDPVGIDGRSKHASRIARRILGLNLSCSHELFHGAPRANAEQAIAALDNVIAHGEPRWHEVMA